MAARRRLGSAFPRVAEEAVAGEGAAFDALYRAYAGPLKAFAATRGADDPDAIADDVMLKVFQHLSSFDGDEAAFVSWIFWIARNRLIDAHRKAGRRPQTADGTPIPENAGDDGMGSATEHVAMSRIGTEGALALLDHLTVEQREVVALRMIGDLSLEQVSRVVGKPVTAVKALQKRGLRQLQKEILAQGVSQ